MKAAALPILLLAAIAACGNLGVQDEPGPPALWTLDTIPDLELHSGAESPFFRVRGAASSASRIAVADDGNSAIVVFDRSGSFLFTVGRRGAGPGEFESVSDVFLLAEDSILAFDSRLARFQLFDGGGTYVRGFGLGAEHGDALFSTMPIAVLRSRVIVGRRIGEPMDGPERDGVTRASVAVMRFDLDGRLLDTVAVVGGWRAYNTQVNGVVMSNMPIPFSENTLMAGAGDRFVLAPSDTNAVRVYSSDGVLIGSIEAAAPPGAAVTQQEIAAFRRRALENAPPAMRQQLAAVYAEMPFPNTMAPFTWAHVGEDSTVWLRTSRTAEGSDAFIVFDPAGARLARVMVPSELSPMVLSARSILGTWTDSLGIESIRIYRVRD